jgi:hypothetical protein
MRFEFGANGVIGRPFHGGNVAGVFLVLTIGVGAELMPGKWGMMANKVPNLLEHWRQQPVAADHLRRGAFGVGTFPGLIIDSFEHITCGDHLHLLLNRFKKRVYDVLNRFKICASPQTKSSEN